MGKEASLSFDGIIRKRLRLKDVADIGAYEGAATERGGGAHADSRDERTRVQHAEEEWSGVEKKQAEVQKHREQRTDGGGHTANTRAVADASASASVSVSAGGECAQDAGGASEAGVDGGASRGDGGGDGDQHDDGPRAQ
eukprot:TRINITY_DN347_c0_g1_i2.p8 TRINITY_DN347_c0_g1~~TRINITY_DN347_c0_g1_i2.p8  ORF type:complete len:140 (+),score=31.57 TRINITY_DN347_c0_g1_i2:1967-2386(+)